MTNGRSVSQFKTVIPSISNHFKKPNQNLINSATNPNQNENSIEAHFISLIHASKTTLQLQQIHSRIILHSLSSNSKITTQLISSASRKSIDYALSSFRNFKNPNLFICNALIRGLCENSCFVSTIEHFRLMMKLDVRPDRLTFPFVLKSIARLNVKWAGDLVYGGILRMGLEYDDFVRVSLVDMYVKVELLGHALKVFDESTERNKLESVLLWNVIVNGCCKNGELKKALELFEVMPQRNIGSWNSMINGLMRNGEVQHAVEFFDRMEERNVVSWTTIVHGLSQNGMQEKGVRDVYEDGEGGGNQGK
ncbi:Pentatricopeptide repeat-containing protein [Abeliophyllum distichum]|uniref:Pentatricopeptide repeat-containing protein n=1 Tax=Abeliophyllum distichum TaxID=126358 RepID=A0ABD1PZX1_9LAMI